ncbi:hypothetical protein B0A48_12646 [Cryoendolithus antarcticus]|uniref:Grh/CP2 DB domain-containing protein n=1 Tax=Cryoendolithus antarcticus TaxID=1507870 RepID=A0A1V8SRA9_9PEZI|nr:hypothetical protein B0A48_12646 [Cryoendolithus antarcticus]
MFQNRKTSQKPSDNFIKDFKDNFPGLRQNSQSASSAHGSNSTVVTDAPEASLRSLEDGQHDAHDMKVSLDAMSRPPQESWNFGPSGLTPSFLDANPHSFNMFPHQMQGYYTPTPGGTNTIYHNQAGDLHTPTYPMGMGTPLSMPNSGGALHAGHQGPAFHAFQPQMPQHFQHQQHQQQFHNVNPFQMHHQHPQAPPQVFAPHQFTHHPGFDHFDGPQVHESPVDNVHMDMHHHHTQHHSPEMVMHPQSFQHQQVMPPPPPAPHPTGEKFRFHVTMNAPTAMVKQSDEIPITYLNKGQAYTLNVVDTHAHQPVGPVRYRTFVRVSFEDEQQRLKPAACWQLWKEGRGTNEAHQRGGRLQAVEYVENVSALGIEDPSKPRIELESASFDGFCVTWSPPNGTAECPISVRFNFLSTDFSHSKGVKGIPVRLCAKTEMISERSPSSNQNSGSEVCYCKVKLFRDHGAERKLSNDVAHVKKTIDKLNQQIVQIESGMRDNGKRKRSNSITRGNDRPGKVQKHRRTWSMTSVTSNGGRGGAEEDLHMKLLTLQDMFTSTRPASILYLRGAEQDDPDLHPVMISGEQPLVRADSGDTSAWDRQQPPPTEDSFVSPTPSSLSPDGSRRGSAGQLPTPFGLSRVSSNEWSNHPQTAISDINTTAPVNSPSTSKAIKIQTRSPSSGQQTGNITAIDVDASYQPPAPRTIKPVACFYIQPRLPNKSSDDSYYRAVYLMSRTVKDLVNVIAMKCDIEPTMVARTVRVCRTGLNVLFDDDCVQELEEGQDMLAEFVETSEDNEEPSREWDAADLCDGDLTTLHNTSSISYELRLTY